MSHADSDKEAKWIWFDGNAWQSYDDETNKHIEYAYINGEESASLCVGPIYAQFPNVHRVYFDYNTNPPSFNQINVITKDIIHIKRTLHFKLHSHRFVNNHSSSDDNNHVVITNTNHQKAKRTIKKKRKKSTNKHANYTINTLSTPTNGNQNKSLLSNIERIQIYKHLYTIGHNKTVIDKAIKTFNNTFKSNAPILNDLNDIIQYLTDIITMVKMTKLDRATLNGDHNGYHDEEEQGSQESKGSNTVSNGHIHPPPPPSSCVTLVMNGDDDDRKMDDFKIGAWIEVRINNNWIPGKIIDVNWSSRNPVSIAIGYQDVFTKRAKQITFCGSDINRNKVRTLRNTINIKKNHRFNFDDNDNWRRRGDHNNMNNMNMNGGRFNRNNLSIHKFSFEYHKDNKKYDEKNAKHPSEYINRKCFKCKGSGKCQLKGRERERDSYSQYNDGCLRCKASGYVSIVCTKCINGTGVYRNAYSLIHSKCNGHGCVRCNDSGKYPLHDILCNNCKGSGLYKMKCTHCDRDYKENERNQRYNQCISGYRLPQLIPFVPKRENRKLSVHGALLYDDAHCDNDLKGMHNMKRLYHATDRCGADGIIETGVMFRGGNASYGEGIVFTDSGRNAEIKARHKGYLVIADVFIGRCKDDYYVDNEMTFSKLHEMGFDSVRGHWILNGIEYVVYNWDQVWVHVVLPFEQVNFAALK